jgi:hypothetical protein
MATGCHFTPATSGAPVTRPAPRPAQAVTSSLTESKAFPVRRSSMPIVICDTP